jgi:predicted polyphosphate/ATP-dependent NAD kinase
LKRAKEMGAVSEAPIRAKDALEVIIPFKEKIEIITCPSEMGEEVVKQCGFKYKVIGSINKGQTTPEDTIKAARKMTDLGVRMILFAGGDGTARDICEAIGSDVAVVGIPAGVKIHSAVYATTPRNAGKLSLLYLEGRLKKYREAEVMDIDEDAFRMGAVTAKLYGYLKIPLEERLFQGLKSGSAVEESSAIFSIARYIVDIMEDDCMYIIGPGTTTRAIMECLQLPFTLLGVDVIYNKHLVATDVSEKQLLDLIHGHGKMAKVIVTIIGGQGYIFGRGNQQISPSVLNKIGKDNIIVIAPQSKIIGLQGRPMLIDLGDYKINQLMSGYYRVVTDYNSMIMYKAE